MTEQNNIVAASILLERFNAYDIDQHAQFEISGVQQCGMATSGLNDYDYQNLPHVTNGQKDFSQVHTINKIPIPTEILEHFKHIKCHCMMGLFPEIGRAWLTIDSEIYLWSFEQGGDISFFDGLNHLILSVGLIRPKSGVFIDDIQFLLVLTTPIEIVILGVTFSTLSKTVAPHEKENSIEELQLMSKPIFILSTDNISMNFIKGADNGRIFLGGRDGSLYEIFYQAETSWLGRRCRKINHSQSLISCMVPSFFKIFSENDPIKNIAIDNSRSLLYLLTERGSIEVWNMGCDYNTMRRLAKLSQNEIIKCAASILKTVDALIFKTIISICPLQNYDCNYLHLIAVTESGVRLFFTTKINSGSQLQDMNNEESSISQTDVLLHGLYLVHIRLPPGYTPNTTINKPKQIQVAHYNQGTFLMISMPQQDQNILWSICSAPFPYFPYSTEAITVLPLDSIVWGVSELKKKSESKIISHIRNARTQNKVVLLTNQGVHIIALLKPIDLLQQLLIDCQGAHHEVVKSFFQCQQSGQEACFISLLIACDYRVRGSDIATWATQSFMLYGDEVHKQLDNRDQYAQNLFSRSPAFSAISNVKESLNEQTSSQIAGASFGGSLSSSILQNTGNLCSTQVSSNNSANQRSYKATTSGFSFKHDSLYLYVSRLLRPVWKLICSDINMCSTLSISDCSSVLEDLFSIKEFVEINFFNDVTCNSFNINSNSNTRKDDYDTACKIDSDLPTSVGKYVYNESKNTGEEIQLEENRSILSLYCFLKKSSEIFALWKILCEHSFSDLMLSLTKEDQTTLKTCTFRDLILSKTDLCATLIVNLVNAYLKDNATITSISSRLRKVCPTLYRHEDAVCFKATEILLSTRNSNSEHDKATKLVTALQLCKDTAPTLPLQTICQQFTLAGFYKGVVELVASCAAKLDPDEIGIHFYNNDEPPEDQEGHAALSARSNCYKEMRTLLDYIYQANFEKHLNNNLTTSSALILDNTEANSNIEIMKIVNIAIQVKDPLLHICVYEWLLAHNMVAELLSLSEPSLGEYLRRNVFRRPDNLKLIDLLWKYYEKNNFHIQAARILDSLATSQNKNIPLDQRLEYLARAVMCIRNDSRGYNASNEILLKEIEDKLEIARVQKTVLDTLSSDSSKDNTQAIKDLNSELHNISNIYQNYADPFGLWECKLAILNCSHHNDPLLIESIWKQIINHAAEGSFPVNDRSRRLFTKIEILIKQYGQGTFCFPLPFIIRELEMVACRYKFRAGSVPETVFRLNFDMELLLDNYLSMMSMNERIWRNEGNEWQLVESSICLVSLLINNSNKLYRNKRRLFGKSQDIISSCLNQCYQKPNTEQLQRQLKEVQSRLNRAMT